MQWKDSILTLKAAYKLCKYKDIGSFWFSKSPNLIFFLLFFLIRERTDESDYIEIIKNAKGGNDLCQSYVGRKGGKQALTLNKNCYDYGPIAHELFHVLGFPHENQRLDSQDYIKRQ